MEQREQHSIESVGASIRAYLLARGCTPVKLSERLYLTPQAVYRWLRGEGDPGIINLLEIAAVCGVTVDELTTGGEMLRYKSLDVAQLKDCWVYIFNRGVKVYAEKFDKRLTIDERKAVVDEFLKSKGESKNAE